MESGLRFDTASQRLQQILLIGLVWFIAGCATSRDDIVPLHQKLPTQFLREQEQKIRNEVVEYEKTLEAEHAFIDDPELESYLKEIATSLLKDVPLVPNTVFTFKVLRDPTVNAFALITGHIYIHSGMLARLENEAELALVMAHEISHSYHRDTLYQIQNLKRKTVAYKMFGLVLTPAATFFGAGGLSENALVLAYATSVIGYGRMEEAKADEFAIQQILKVGYNPKEAIKLFDVFLAEKKKYQRGIEIFFLSSHPSNERRKKDAQKWIEKNSEKIKAAKAERVETERFLQKTAIIRRENAKLNLDMRRFFHALQDIEKAIKQNSRDAAAYYYKGEIYQGMVGEHKTIKAELSRNKWNEVKKKSDEKRDKEWFLNSFRTYRHARKIDPAYAPSYKGLGGLYFRQEQMDLAKGYFEKYLELSPKAEDHRRISRYLEDISAFKKEKGVS